MRGFLKFPPNSSRRTSIAGFVMLAALAVLHGGCSGGSESAKSETPASDLDGFIAESEKGFNPSIYNPEVDMIVQQEQTLYTALRTASVYAVAQPETIPGFRIQVMLTQEIDEAMAIRDSLSGNFQDEYVYVVYDAPTYKIRIGNYPDRASASPLLKQLIRRGFTDAWIVPDNVLKNPPPRLPDHPIEPKSPLQNRH